MLLALQTLDDPGDRWSSSERMHTDGVSSPLLGSAYLLDRNDGVTDTEDAARFSDGRVGVASNSTKHAMESKRGQHNQSINSSRSGARGLAVPDQSAISDDLRHRQRADSGARDLS